MNRLPAPWGHRIDRNRPLDFSFEDQAVQGLEGDCIASALAASGQWMLSRSFKYHRPRGLVSMAGAEANTLVQLPNDPNAPADLTRLRDGMRVTAQNVNGSLDEDRDAVMDRLGRFMPVGFYYRSFIGPNRSSWLKLWEPLIRKKAGLGRVDRAAPPARYVKSDCHCDLLVVGAGPSGLSAAITAAKAGADVILCDENPELGGSLTWARGGEGDLASLRSALDGLPNLRILLNTACNGWYEDNWLPLISGSRLWRARARQVILAPGTIDQPAVFRNNDLPGIMLASASQRLLRHYAVRPGRRAVVLASEPAGYEAALDLLDAGIDLAAIVDPRPGGSGGALAAHLARRGARQLSGTVEEARGTKGNRHLEAVRIGREWLRCDLLAVAIGDVPAWQLPCQAGGRLGHDAVTGRYRIEGLERNRVWMAGGVTGTTEFSDAIADGEWAASAVLERLGRAASENPTATKRPIPAPRPPAYVPPIAADPKGRDFVDFDEDLQVKDILDAVREGYSEMELVKRFSTLGMGPSQGRHSAAATSRIVAAATQRSVSAVGATTARPPVGPETLGVLAGPHFGTIERRTALHDRHVALGARMMPAGSWIRPFHYGGHGSAVETIEAEILAVRQTVGLLDVSTLGKIEVRGPDAGAFLDRIYTMAHASQPVGRVRYCLMLNEMGAIVDDGVAYRLAENCFYVTATTGAVARVYASMTLLALQWRMQVDIVNMTAAFSGLNLTGPLARDVLQRLSGDIDFARGTFNYLDGRTGTLAGVPLRAMRIGFTGELSYELHCPSSLAPRLWDAVMDAGRDAGLKPYGLEASRILRLEKGHILIGQDTDALTTPSELGFDWAVSRKKPFFVGKRSIEMRARMGETRRLVGLDLKDLAEIPGESCLVLREGLPVGHVTSVGRSPTLGHAIALAYVHVEDARQGRTVTVKCRSGRLVQAPVTAHAFFDPQNARQDL